MINNKLTRNEKRELYGLISRFFVDIAKLVFAGVILAGILKEDVDTLWLLAGGSAVVLIALLIAYNTFIMSKK